MKRLLFVLLAVYLTIGCSEKCPDCPKCPPTADRADSAPCNDDINTDIRNNGQSWCNDPVIYDAHTIKPAIFRDLKNARWTSNAENKAIYWYDVKRLINQNSCYSKYLRFTFDAEAESNASINMELSDCFYEFGSCYSIPLLLNIEKKHSLKESDVLECTICKYKNHETVIFRVTNKTVIPSYTYFDVSDFPKYIEKLSGKKK